MADKISIFGVEEPPGTERGIFKRSSELKVGRGEIDADVLEARLKSFVTSMQSVVDAIPALIGEYSVESVSISAEVSAKGTVSLLGTGGELAGKGGVTFTLTRRS